MKIKLIVKTLELEWPDGKKDVLLIPVGSVETMETWLGEAKDLKDMADKIDDATKVGEVYGLLGSCLSKLIGPKVWKRIEKKSGRNIFAATQIMRELTKLVTEGMNEAQKLNS